MVILNDIKKTLNDKNTFWLNLSVLLYIAFLPFNTFGIDFFHNGRTIKLTEIALLFMVIFGTRAYLREQIAIKKAPWLYTFLMLQASIQFVSVVNSPHPGAIFNVAIAVATYSLLVIILFNAVYSENLLRVILIVMGGVVLIVVIHSFVIYIIQGGVFQTRLQPTILGNDIAHYLSYVLFMFGSGLLYIFFREKTKKMKYILWPAVALWMYVAILPGTKIYQIAMIFFLILLMLVLVGQRKRVFALMIIFIIVFVIQFNIVPVKNQYLLAYNAITGGALDAKESGKRAEILAAALESKLASPPPPAPVAEIAPSPPPPAPVAEIAPSPPPPAPAPEQKPAFLIDKYSDENLMRRRWAGLIGRGSSVDVRMRGLVSGWFMGLSNPWTGIGAGQTPYFLNDFSEKVRIKAQDPGYLAWLPFRDYILTDTKFGPDVVGIYNIYMNAWAETGMLGLIALLGMLVVVIRKGVRALSINRKPGVIQPLLILFPLFITLIMTIHMADYFWVHPWLWTIIALTYTAADLDTETLKHESIKTL